MKRIVNYVPLMNIRLLFYLTIYHTILTFRTLEVLMRILVLSKERGLYLKQYKYNKSNLYLLKIFIIEIFYLLL